MYLKYQKKMTISAEKLPMLITYIVQYKTVDMDASICRYYSSSQPMDQALPKCHKINLGGPEMINGVRKEEQPKFSHTNVYIFFCLCFFMNYKIILPLIQLLN